jgi:quinol monooxygenase YgiN
MKDSCRFRTDDSVRIARIRQEAMLMYVRLVRFAFGPEKQDAAQSLAADLVRAISAQSGCKGATFFGDHADGEYGLYVVWDSKENADAAAAIIVPKLQQHLAANVQRPADIRLFEVLQTSS